jgi:TRAP-type C4-dicarboxylate transport system permease small subunit
MTAIIGFDVAMRLIFIRPTIWADEVSCYLLVGISFLGAAYTLSTGGHIYIETFVQRLGSKTQKRMELVTDILSLVFLVIFVRQAYWLVKDSYVSVKISATLLRTPLYLPQLLFAVGLMWLSLQLLVHILRRHFHLRIPGEAQKAALDKTEQGNKEKGIENDC